MIQWSHKRFLIVTPGIISFLCHTQIKYIEWAHHSLYTESKSYSRIKYTILSNSLFYHIRFHGPHSPYYIWVPFCIVRIAHGNAERFYCYCYLFVLTLKVVCIGRWIVIWCERQKWKWLYVTLVICEDILLVMIMVINDWQC